MTTKVMILLLATSMELFDIRALEKQVRNENACIPWLTTLLFREKRMHVVHALLKTSYLLY